MGKVAKSKEQPFTAARPQDSAEGLLWLPPLRSAGRVKYSEVVDTIEKAVDSSSFSIGQRLPGQRELATHLGVTIATVTKAVGELVRRGVLTAKSGSGTFVADRTHGATVSSRAVQQLNLALNRPPMSPVREMLSAAFAEPGSWRIDTALEYQPIGGSASTRADGAAWLDMRGFKIAAERVLVTCGAHEGLLATMSALLKPGDKVICESLNYTGLRRIAALLGIELIGVPLGPDGMHVEAFARLCRDRGPKAAVLTPVTHNPTATTLDDTARGEVVQAVRRAGMFLLEDDVYGHLSGHSAPLLATLYPEQTIVVSGLSKSITPGLRLGYVSARAEILDAVRDSLYSFGWSAPTPHITIASRLFEAGLAKACLEAQRTEALARMGMFWDAFPTTLRRGPALASYHAWLPLPDERPADAFANELSREGVLVSASTQFLHGSRDAPSAVRLSLGAVETRGELAEALSCISQHFQRSSPSLGAIG